mmetsp:Transcript_51451/g.159599  ORF Transcript_51451/g.159599 Transcript_51451/m.159599 type:complete len:442 (+) Transcript_51451:129-1454(+)
MQSSEGGSGHLATLADVQVYGITLAQLDLCEAVVLEPHALQRQDYGAAPWEDLEPRAQDAVRLRDDPLRIGSEPRPADGNVDAGVLRGAVHELRTEKVRDLQPLHTLRLEGVQVVPIEELLLNRAFTPLKWVDFQRVPADLVHVDQAHGVEEVDGDLDSVVDANGGDVLGRRDAGLVAVKPADVLVYPERPGSALGVGVELERALVRLALLPAVGVAAVLARVAGAAGLVCVAVRDLRASVHVEVGDTGNQDPVDADARLSNMHRRPISPCVLEMEGVTVVRLEPHVDLGEDLVERLVVDDKPERTHLEASYQGSTEEERRDYRQQAGLHEDQGVLAPLADPGISPGRPLQARGEPAGSLPVGDLLHRVRVLHRFVVLPSQAELLDQALAVRDADVDGGRGRRAHGSPLWTSLMVSGGRCSRSLSSTRCSAAHRTALQRQP